MDVFIYYVDLPCAIGGIALANPDGTTTVYINSRWGHNGQGKTKRHELHHAANDHLYSTNTLDEREAGAKAAENG